MSLEGKLPAVLILGMGGDFVGRLRLSSAITKLCGVAGVSLHCHLMMDVRLCLGEDFVHPSDIVLQEVFI